jgi:hypothetical protein
MGGTMKRWVKNAVLGTGLVLLLGTTGFRCSSDQVAGAGHAAVGGAHNAELELRPAAIAVGRENVEVKGSELNAIRRRVGALESLSEMVSDIDSTELKEKIDPIVEPLGDIGKYVVGQACQQASLSPAQPAILVPPAQLSNVRRVGAALTQAGNSTDSEERFAAEVTCRAVNDANGLSSSGGI